MRGFFVEDPIADGLRACLRIECWIIVEATAVFPVSEEKTSCPTAR